jgi:hypothetical protein
MYRACFRVSGMKSPTCAEDLSIALNGIPAVKAEVVYKEEMAEVEAEDHVPLEMLARGARQNGFGLELVSYEKCSELGSC